MPERELVSGSGGRAAQDRGVEVGLQSPPATLGGGTPMEFRNAWAARGDGKEAPWKSPKADFSTALGNPANNAGFPLSQRPDDGCEVVTKAVSDNPSI